MQLEKPITFLRAIKGAPGIVMLALLAAGREPTRQELVECTGYHAATVRGALAQLCALGWVSRDPRRGGWVLTAAGGEWLRSLMRLDPEAGAGGDEFLAAHREDSATGRESSASEREVPAEQREDPATARESSASEREVPANQREISAGLAVPPGRDAREIPAARRGASAGHRENSATRRENAATAREFSASERETPADQRESFAKVLNDILPGSSSEFLKNQERDSQEQESIRGADSPRAGAKFPPDAEGHTQAATAIPDHPLPGAENSSDPDVRAGQAQNPSYSQSLAALREAGVREPKASHLARLRHVTPEFVRAHVDRAREQNHALGTAIHRIEHNWALPTNAGAARRLPKIKPAGHAADCECAWCRLERFRAEKRARPAEDANVVERL